MNKRTLLGLDVGEKWIGVAVADTGVRIAVPLDTIVVDGGEVAAIAELVIREQAATLVVGYPRNQQGQPTAQTKAVEQFVAQLENIDVSIVYQDESLTSVMAEDRLKSYGRPYTKADIDAQAAAIILQDHLEQYYG